MNRIYSPATQRFVEIIPDHNTRQVKQKRWNSTRFDSSHFIENNSEGD